LLISLDAFYNTRQYNCDSILMPIRALLTKYKSAHWSQAIFRGEGCSEIDVLYGRVGFEMCDKGWQREGVSKLAKNSVTYFMDGPYQLYIAAQGCVYSVISAKPCSRPPSPIATNSPTRYSLRPRPRNYVLPFRRMTKTLYLAICIF